MAGGKIAPALAAGNCVVLKPAEQTPLSILFFVDIVKKAGFPAGVINIVNGFGGKAGVALTAHMDVDKIVFTGSTATEREVARLAANNLKEITIGSGGKSLLLVFEDADLDQAVKWELLWYHGQPRPDLYCNKSHLGTRKGVSTIHRTVQGESQVLQDRQSLRQRYLPRAAGLKGAI